jgi:hypothetical protein
MFTVSRLFGTVHTADRHRRCCGRARCHIRDHMHCTSGASNIGQTMFVGMIHLDKFALSKHVQLRRK